MVLELDHGCDETPADREPERDRDEEDGARQNDPDEDEERDPAEERPEPPEGEPIGAPRPDRTIRVQLDQCARGRGHDEPEPEQCERRADDDGEERPRAGRLARNGSESVDARRAGAIARTS